MMEGVPLYIQVRKRIKDEIEQGIVKPDSKGVLPGQQEFADSYNVGIMTVRRAIKDLEQMGLVVSRRGKGLVLNTDTPSYDKSSFGSPRMLHIGVCYFNILMSEGNPVVSRIMSGIEAFARENSIFLHVLSIPSLNYNLEEDTLFSDFQFSHLDGILLLASISGKAIMKIKESQIPFVVNGYISDEDAICSVPDATMEIYYIADAILARGHRNIILFGGSSSYVGYGMMLTGHKLALSRYGQQLDPEYISDEDYDTEAAISFVRDMLAKGKQVDAVAAFDDIMAARIKDFLHANGRQDILVAGRGNFPGYQDKVDLTTDHNLRDIGYDLAAKLVDLTKGIRPKQLKLFYEPTLIERSLVTS